VYPTTVNAGEEPHPAASTPEEELVLIKEGIDGYHAKRRAQTGGPGSVVFNSSERCTALRMWATRRPRILWLNGGRQARAGDKAK